MSVSVAGATTPAWCPPEALDGLSGAWRIDREGGFVCDSPGVYVVDGVVQFVLPRCYAASRPEGATALRAALVLLRTMARYRTRPERKAVDVAPEDARIREVGSVQDDLGWLEVALLLLADAERNGPLNITASDVSPRRQGRIHWPRTQQRGFHVVDGAEVMTSPLWRSRRGVDPEDALALLHRDTCSTIRASLGRGGGHGGSWTTTEALSVLDGRDHTLFADRHRQVARWLRHYWTKANGPAGTRRSGLSAMWSPKFPLVWESMLREVMRGEPFGMPSGTYRLVTGATQSGLHLVPDFIVDVIGKRLVVDAKHYSLDDLPRTESIAKQLLYRWFASSESGHGTVPLADLVSVFIVPAVGRSATAELIGTHELDSGDAALKDYGRVRVVAADFEAVAEAYVAGASVHELARVGAG